MMEILYYRKIAQIAHRDGDDTIRAVADRAETAPRIAKRDRKALKAWFLTWLNRGSEK
jgi:hypothetical protein